MTKTAPFLLGLAPFGLALTAGLLAAGSADAGRISPNLLDLAKRNVTTPVGVIVRFRLPDTGQGRAAFKTLRNQLQGAIAQLGPSAGFVNSALKQAGAELWLDQSIYLKLTPGQARLVATLPIDAAAEVVDDDLRAARRDLAAAASVPPYVIFLDSTLRAIAALRPTTLATLGGVPGVGARKLEAYGQAMLAALRE